ncbi:MAG: hypothetical protein QOF76_4715, partial [Solirubrobacteraceae bacterium]|nr:hypothetical protein [Solirubrobacteraceae bacterium]
MNASTLLDTHLEAGRAEKPALITADGTLTYGDVAALVARTAAGLREAGIGR